MNAGIVPAISQRFLRQHPQVQLRVVHADIGLEQFGPLRERRVELLLGRLREPFVQDDLIFEPLIQEPFVAVAGADSQWARRRRIELANLMEESWVLPPHDSTPGGIISGIFRR
jgi:DNA-binding transcriptional LysR family regulator